MYRVSTWDCEPKLCHVIFPSLSLSDLLFLYLVVLCQLSICSILATVVHFIPHPNSILFYNFASIGISYGFQSWIGSELVSHTHRIHTHTHTNTNTHTHSRAAPMWISLPAIVMYSIMVPWCLYTFPNSFSLGEAVIVCQGLTMMFIDTSIQLVHLVSNDMLCTGHIV